MTTGQPIKVPTDRNKYDNEFMENLKLQIDINDKNLQANRLYQNTGQLPPATQMADNRTTSEKLADIEGLKRSIVSDLKPIADSQFALALIQGILNSPLNINNSLFRYLAQNAPQIAQQLKKVYKFGIAGDDNDVQIMVDFIKDAYQKTSNTFQSIKTFMNSDTTDKGSSMSSNVDSLSSSIDNAIFKIRKTLQNATNEGAQNGQKLISLMALVRKLLPTSSELNYLLSQNTNDEYSGNVELLPYVKPYIDLILNLPKPSVITTMTNQINKGVVNGNKNLVDEVIRKFIMLFTDFLPPSMGGNQETFDFVEDISKNMLSKIRQQNYQNERSQEVNTIKRLEEVNREQQKDAKAQRVYIANPSSDPAKTINVLDQGYGNFNDLQQGKYPSFSDVQNGNNLSYFHPQEESEGEEEEQQQSSSSSSSQPVQTKTRNTYIFDRINDLTISQLDELYHHLFQVEEDDDTSDNDKMNHIYDALSGRDAEYDPRDTHRKNRLGIGGLGLKKGIKGRGINSYRHSRIKGGMVEETDFFFEPNSEKIPIDVTPKTNSFIPKTYNSYPVLNYKLEEDDSYKYNKKPLEGDFYKTVNFFNPPNYMDVYEGNAYDIGSTKFYNAFTNNKKFPNTRDVPNVNKIAREMGKYDSKFINKYPNFGKVDLSEEVHPFFPYYESEPYLEENPLFPSEDIYDQLQHHSHKMTYEEGVREQTRENFLYNKINETPEEDLFHIYDIINYQVKLPHYTNVDNIRQELYNLSINAEGFADIEAMNKKLGIKPELIEFYTDDTCRDLYAQYIKQNSEKRQQYPKDIKRKIFEKLKDLNLINNQSWFNITNKIIDYFNKPKYDPRMHKKGNLKNIISEMIVDNANDDNKIVNDMDLLDMYETYVELFSSKPPLYIKKFGGLRTSTTVNEIKQAIYNKIRGDDSKKFPYLGVKKDDIDYSIAIKSNPLINVLYLPIKKNPITSNTNVESKDESKYENIDTSKLLPENPLLVEFKKFFKANSHYFSRHQRTELKEKIKIYEQTERESSITERKNEMIFYEKYLEKDDFNRVLSEHPELYKYIEKGWEIPKKKYNITVENFLKSEEFKPLIKNIRGKYKTSTVISSESKKTKIPTFNNEGLIVGGEESKEEPIDIFPLSKRTTPPKVNKSKITNSKIAEAYLQGVKDKKNPRTQSPYPLNRKSSPKLDVKAEIQKNIDLHKRTGRGMSSDYREFGDTMINHKKLDDGILTIRRKSNINIPDMPSKRISRKLQKIIKHISGGGIPEHNDLNDLDDGEKDYLHKLISKSNLQERLSVPAPSKDQEEKDFHQFEVMKGEIMSGNDSKELVKNFKILILKLSKQNILPKTEVNELLTDLLSLGY